MPFGMPTVSRDKAEDYITVRYIPQDREISINYSQKVGWAFMMGDVVDHIASLYGKSTYGFIGMATNWWKIKQHYGNKGRFGVHLIRIVKIEIIETSSKKLLEVKP